MGTSRAAPPNIPTALRVGIISNTKVPTSTQAYYYSYSCFIKVLLLTYFSLLVLFTFFLSHFQLQADESLNEIFRNEEEKIVGFGIFEVMLLS